jgi:LuxR family maltose regulon positive regulatory protein
LDEGDNDLIRFLMYLVAALQTVAASMGKDVLDVLLDPPEAGQAVGDGRR